MIALDTNIIIRYLVRDDVKQSEAARALLELLTAERPGYVCREVAVEVVWLLKRAYGYSRAQIAAILKELLITETLVFEVADDVARAAFRYSDGEAEFSDLMIMAAARRAGIRSLHTLDRKLSRLEGAVLLDGDMA